MNHVAAAALSAVFLTAAAAGPAAGQPAQPDTRIHLARMTIGYTNYNRPGADMETHNKEVWACVQDAAQLISEDEQLGTGQNQGLAGLIIGGMINSAAHRGVVAGALENCMVVRGWRVVHLTDGEGAALAALPPSEISTYLAQWVGEQSPHGDVVRVWNNDAANASTDRFAIRPDHTNNGQLSLTAATSATLKQFPLSPVAARTSLVLDPKWTKKNLKPNQLSLTPPEAGVIIVHLKGMTLGNGISLTFTRVGPDLNTPASNIDHAPDNWVVAVPLLFAKRGGNTMAMVAPAGRWRISQMGILPVLNFCLGAPSFEIKAGEVVYAGSFDLNAPDIGPDLSLEPAKTWLAGQPEADKVKPAVYTNGSVGRCADNEIYALEIKGAPFEPDYHWGSAPPATPAPVPAAPAVSTPAAN